jgi:hypothetical protein
VDNDLVFFFQKRTNRSHDKPLADVRTCSGPGPVKLVLSRSSTSFGAGGLNILYYLPPFLNVRD